MVPALAAAAALFVAALLWVACGWSSFLIAARLTGRVPTSVRWCATAVVGYWLLTAAFTVLVAASAFRRAVAVPAWLLAAVLTHVLLDGSGRGCALFAADLRRVGELWRVLWRTPVRWLVLTAGLIMGLRLARGLVAPPLAWDALTYHLLRAGRWVQEGSYARDPAPDAWAFYEYFLPNGDVLWAWAMLPVYGDAMVGAAGVLVWATILLGAYGAVRAMGAPETRAVLAALGVGFVPACSSYVTSAYVENTVLALFVMATMFVARATVTASRADVALTAAALGVAAGTKLNAAPLLVLGMLIVVASVRRRRGWRAALAAAALSVPVIAPATILGYVRAWWDHGSPVYPVPLTIGGHVLLPGNEMLTLLLTGKLAPGIQFSWAWLLEALFVPELASGFDRALGPAVPLIVAAAVLGFVRTAGLAGHRATALFLIGCAAAAVWPFLMSEDMFILRTYFARDSGRFLLPAVGALAIPAALAPGRLAEATWLLIGIVGLALAIPRGWSEHDATAIAQLLAAVLPAAACAGMVLAWARRTRRWRVGAGLASGLAMVALLPLPGLRENQRYRIYEAAAHADAYDVHTLNFRYASAWPIWEYFDDGPSHRIAVVAGFASFGTNWFRYPLLGTRLQNRLSYVPPTRDGSIIDYRRHTELTARADFAAWVSRLVDRDIEFVVGLFPPTPEQVWMHEHPELFELVASGEAGLNRAYRFRREIAGRFLRRDAPASRSARAAT